MFHPSLGRDEKRVPPKTLVWEARILADILVIVDTTTAPALYIVGQ